MFNNILKNNKIKNFNKKWEGKTIKTCEYLWNEMFIHQDKSCFCSECTNVPSDPPQFQTGTPKFNFNKYITALDNELSQCINGTAKCNTCRLSKSTIIPKLTNENIKNFHINHFSKCNCNCIYCSRKDKTADTKIKLLPYIKKLEKEKMLSKDCLFTWAGGEATILEEFDTIFQYLKKKKYKQHINSSGKLYSNSVYEALKSGYIVVISPDSGTERTYNAIKRCKGFKQVWNNIKKYSETNGNLIIKYIVFNLNNSKHEIYEFMERCKENNVKSVYIDCEFNSSSGAFEYPITITNKDIIAARYLKELCIINNIKYIIGNNWKEEHKIQISKT